MLNFKLCLKRRQKGVQIVTLIKISFPRRTFACLLGKRFGFYLLYHDCLYIGMLYVKKSFRALLEYVEVRFLEPMLPALGESIPS